MDQKLHSSGNKNQGGQFDLDSYIAEKSNPELNTAKAEEHNEQKNYHLKNVILIIGMMLITALWYNNWQLPAFLSSSENSSAEIVQAAPSAKALYNEISQPATAPGIAIPVLPQLPAFSTGKTAYTVPPLDISMADYLLELKSQGYLENQISTFSARQLYHGNVPISYLNELNAEGLLEGLSYNVIQEYYIKKIPFTYLKELQKEPFYDDLSFIDISGYWTAEVSLDYLRDLHNKGYLDELSYVDVLAYYEAGITTQYLDKLKESGLYEDLNFLDVVDLYQQEAE